MLSMPCQLPEAGKSHIQVRHFQILRLSENQISLQNWEEHLMHLCPGFKLPIIFEHFFHFVHCWLPNAGFLKIKTKSEICHETTLYYIVRSYTRVLLMCHSNQNALKWTVLIETCFCDILSVHSAYFFCIKNYIRHTVRMIFFTYSLHNTRFIHILKLNRCLQIHIIFIILLFFSFFLLERHFLFLDGGFWRLL